MRGMQGRTRREGRWWRGSVFLWQRRWPKCGRYPVSLVSQARKSTRSIKPIETQNHSQAARPQPLPSPPSSAPRAHPPQSAAQHYYSRARRSARRSHGSPAPRPHGCPRDPALPASAAPRAPCVLRASSNRRPSARPLSLRTRFRRSARCLEFVLRQSNACVCVVFLDSGKTVRGTPRTQLSHQRQP